MMDKVDGKELPCIPCNIGHVVLNKWVARTTHLNRYIKTNDSDMDHVALVKAIRTDGHDKRL